MNTKKNILITGGAGFIGSAIAKKFLNQKYRVVVVDDFSTNKISPVIDKNIVVYKTSILKENELKNIIGRERPNIISHHAGISSGFTAKKINQVNVYGTASILKYINYPEFEQFIFASSASVYGKKTIFPISEKSRLNPINDYGKSKLAAEQLIKKICESYGKKYCIFRYANVYGPGQELQKHPGAVAKFILALLNGQAIRLFNHGKHIRDYIYISDVVAANLNAIGLKNSHVLNISSQQGVETLELFNQIQKILANYSSPKMDNLKTNEIDKSILQNSLAIKKLGWKPNVSLATGLKKTVKAIMKYES